MADMIDADTARSILGCDEATLQNMVDNGTIRAQRVDGQLLLNGDDVNAQAGGGVGESSDSILVLDSESEDLSIDLGEVIDDGAQTMEMGGGGSELESKSGTDSLTFGDELEVVTFDDGNTEELTFDDSATGELDLDDAANTENLNFTDSNTAVMTDVDETVVGTATATSDYQTVDFEDDDDGEGGATGSSNFGGSVRRSVRSQRVIRAEAPRIHPFFVVIAVLTVLVAGALIAPYYFLSYWPKEEVRYYNQDRAFGMDDNAWTNIASSIVGFSVEPDAETWRELHPDGEQHIPLSQWDPSQPDRWRHREYRGKYKEEPKGTRAKHFIINNVLLDEEGNPTRAQVLDESGATLEEYPVNREEKKLDPEGEPVTKFVPQLKYN